MKQLTVIGVAGLSLLLGFASGQRPASGPLHVTVDGRQIIFPDMQPKFIDNHAMVPMRGVFERLHASVMWNNAAQQVTCISDHNQVELNIGDTQATVNGEKVLFDAPARLSHGRTLVPLRFLAKSLGARVDWDEATQTVNISSADYLARKR